MRLASGWMARVHFCIETDALQLSDIRRKHFRNISDRTPELQSSKMGVVVSVG
jgi:hypothetical protein